MEVKFVCRGSNGNQCVFEVYWEDVCHYVTKNMDDLEDYEILLVTVDGTCIYSALSNPPIIWDDITGYFG